MTEKPRFNPPEWKPVSEHPGIFDSGEKYLVALRVANTKTCTTSWEFHKIEVLADEWAELYYADAVEICGESAVFDDWAWEDFEFYIKLGETE